MQADQLVLEVLKDHDHIQQLLLLFETHRREAEVRFVEDIMVQADKIAKAVTIEQRMPRQWRRLTQWPNYQSKTMKEYYRVVIFILYFESISSF